MAIATVTDTHSEYLFRGGVCMCQSSVCSCTWYTTVSALNRDMYKLWIHEPSSELVKIAQVSCGDFDISIFFKTLFLVNVHVPAR